VAGATGAAGAYLFSSGTISLSVTIEKSPFEESFFFSTGFGSSFFSTGFGASTTGYGLSSDLTCSGASSPEVSMEKSP